MVDDREHVREWRFTPPLPATTKQNMRYFKKMSPDRQFLGSDGQYFAFPKYGVGKDCVGLMELNPEVEADLKKIKDFELAIADSNRGGIAEIQAEEYGELKKKYARLTSQGQSFKDNSQTLHGPLAPMRVFRPQRNPLQTNVAPAAVVAATKAEVAGPPPTRKVSPRRGRVIPADPSGKVPTAATVVVQ